MLQTGIKWFQELLCYLTGTKWTLVPAQNQPVLIERGRIALFLVVDITPLINSSLLLVKTIIVATLT